MLLRFFKGTGPGVIVLISVTLLAVWASAFIKLKDHFSLYFDLDPMPLYGVLSKLIGTNPLPGLFFTLILVSFMAFLIVNMNTSLFFINERTFLPGLFYILLSGIFPQYQLMNPAIIAAVFLMLAIRRIMEAYRIQGTAYSFFDAGILIGAGSLFYANLIWFGLIVIIGIALLRTGNFKEIAISLIGLVTPFVLTFGVYYILGKDLRALQTLIEYNLFDKLTSYVFMRITVVALLFLGIVTLISIIYIFMLQNTKKIKARKTFSLLFWIFLISMVVYFILHSVSVEIIWIAGIPVSYFLAHFFVYVKKRIVPEIIFSVLFALVMIMQIWYLK